jgi:hypothetical protein
MMVEYRRGVENVPLRNVNNSCPILVIVYDLKNDDKPIIEKRMEYSDPEDRKWLGRISFWAYSNNCSVETIAIADAEPALVKAEEGA